MKRVLLVDDEPYIENIANIFRRHGVEALIASTGEEGIELYKEQRPDCVLLDINLPGLKGTDVFYRLKDMDPEVVVYFITGEVGCIALNKALDDGAKDYLLKPVDITRLKEIIEARTENLFPDLRS